MSRAALPAMVAIFAAIICHAPDRALAVRGLETGFADPLYTSGDAADRQFVFDRTVEARAGIVRINVLWRNTARSQPVDPANPADPAYDFGPYDAAVQEAATRGLAPMLTIYQAPTWAEGPGRPAHTPAGSWRPQPQALADFMRALATRYSGSFGFPRVRLFQVWNEPNLTSYINPQAESAGIYTGMLNAAYGALKAVHPDNVVITAGTAPYGDPAGGARTRPLSFWRDVFCVQGKKKPKPRACSEQASFDILAHHPINTTGGPRTSAIDPDDISTPDLKHLVSLLRAAEGSGQTGTGGKHPVWATEIWWESDPPDGFEGVRLKRQARWLEEAYYLLWKQGASAVVNLQVRDAPFSQDSAFADTATGAFFADGSPKPSFTALRFPFVTERKSKRKLRAWGKAPAGGRLVIQRNRRGKWRKVDSFKVNDGEVFKHNLRLSGKPKLRARVGGEASLVWRGD